MKNILFSENGRGCIIGGFCWYTFASNLPFHDHGHRVHSFENQITHPWIYRNTWLQTLCTSMSNFNYNFSIYINVMITHTEKMLTSKIWRVAALWGHMHTDLCLNNSTDVVVWNLNPLASPSYLQHPSSHGWNWNIFTEKSS